MKTTRLTLFGTVLVGLLFCYLALGQTQGKRTSDYPQITAPNARYLFNLADPGITNYAMRYDVLQSNIVLNIKGGDIITTNLYATNIFSQNIFNTNNIITTNLFATNIYTTNLFATNIFNNILVTSNIYTTNLYATNIYTTNIYTTNLITGTLNADELDVDLLYATNFFTLYTNAPYLNTDGNGKLTVGSSLSPTNFNWAPGANISFTTNGSGKVTVAGSATNIINVVSNNLTVTTNLIVYDSITVQTNVTINQNLFVTTNFSTNLYFVSGKGNTLNVTNLYISALGSLNNSNATANSIATWGPAKDLTNGSVAARLSFSGNALDLASGVATPGTYRSVTVDTYGRTTAGTTPTTFSGYAISDSAANLFSALTTWDGSSWTNLTYKYTTNAVTGLTLTFGKNYFTNVSTANITISAVNATDVAAMETLCIRCTNSSGSDFTVTLPNGIGSPGLGLPPVITVTNKHETRIYIQHDGNQSTNCWFIPTY
jgi:hypothetical protein